MFPAYAEKSPLRRASVGTHESAAASKRGRTSLMCSKPTVKKVLSRPS